MFVQCGEHSGGPGHHRGDRQVDLTGDDDEGHRNDHDHLLDVQLEQVDEVVDAQIARRLGDVEHDDRQQGSPRGATPTCSAAPSYPWRALSRARDRGRSRKRRVTVTSSTTASRISVPRMASRQNSLICSNADQALVQQSDQHCAEERADDRAAATECADATDDCRGDRGELESGTGGHVDRSEPAHVEKAREPSERSARRRKRRPAADAGSNQPGGRRRGSIQLRTGGDRPG